MSTSEDIKSHKNGNEMKSDSKLSSNAQVKLCPFHDFRICNNVCNFYICRGYPNVVKERIKKGYANEYFTSTLF